MRRTYNNFTIYIVQFTMNTMIKIIFNTLLGIILILIWAQFVNIREIVLTISKVNLPGLLLVFSFMLASPVLRAIRLQFFLSEIKKIALKDLIFLNGAAMILNFFIPIRMGEIAKGVFLNTNYNIHIGKAIIWVFIDRFVDFLVVLGAAALLLGIVPTSISINFIIIIMTVLIFALTLTYLAVFQKDFAKQIVKFLIPLLIVKSIKRPFERFSHFILESFSILRRHPKDLSLMIGVTILAYGADSAIWYYTFSALGESQGFLKMYLGQLLSALTYLIPAAPGYVGSAEASGTLILSGVFGINPNLASAMIVLWHILTALFVIVFGLISIFSLKLNLSLIFKKALKRS